MEQVNNVIEQGKVNLNVNVDSVDQVKDKENIINSAIEKLQNNNFVIYFYCPAMNIPSGGISVLIKQARLLQDNGYKTVIIYEPRPDSSASFKESQKKGKRVEIYEKFNPIWLGDTIKGMKFMSLGDSTIKYTDGTSEKCEKLVINVEDMVVIPEGFPDIMRRFAEMPCKKIVLAQSWYYVLNAMRINESWQHLGIKDVISVSDGITEYLNAIMPGLNIKQYSQSIDRKIFKPIPYTEKVPKIAFMPGRSQEATLKTFNVIKTFYCFYPQYRWVRFDELRGLEKNEFANRLAESALALYTDEIAGFGTLPLEAMACGTHVVGWTPLGGKEYINPRNGFWAHNGEVFQLAELIGIALETYLTSKLDSPEITAEYEQTLERYTQEKEQEMILNIYNEYKNERIAEFQQFKQ